MIRPSIINQLVPIIALSRSIATSAPPCSLYLFSNRFLVLLVPGNDRSILHRPGQRVVYSTCLKMISTHSTPWLRLTYSQKWKGPPPLRDPSWRSIMEKNRGPTSRTFLNASSRNVGIFSE